MAIRALTVDDVDVYREVRLRALRSDPGAFSSKYADNLEYDDATWRSRLTGFAGRPGQVFVDVNDDGDGDGTVGMVGVGLTEEPAEAILWGMWVDPSVRGTGVGRRLVDATVVWARAHGASSVVLFVMGANAGAVDMYERCGFVLDDEICAEAPPGCEDELRMRRPLG